MLKHTFVKGLILPDPALYMEPFTSLNEAFFAKARNHPETEFIVFFIGSYGQSVFTEFRQMRKRHPVWVRRDRVTMDAYSDENFVAVSEIDNPVELLAEYCNGDLVCFVLDSCDSGSVALAKVLIGILRKFSEAILIGLSPLGTETIGKDRFNLSIKTSFGDEDHCAYLLISLCNNYLGERGFRDAGAAKSIHDDLLKNHFVHAHCGIAVHEGDLSTSDVQALVREANQSIQDLIHEGMNGRYLAFLQMHPSKEDSIMVVAYRIQKELHELTKGQKTGNGLILICNRTLPEDKTELILFYLYERAI
jgi:hypothetical protein